MLKDELLIKEKKEYSSKKDKDIDEYGDYKWNNKIFNPKYSLYI